MALQMNGAYNPKQKSRRRYLMYLCKEEVQKILNTMDLFPEATSFELLQDASNGIGSTTSLIVHTTINGLDGEFKTEISGVENW
jgi:hypothetical protein